MSLILSDAQSSILSEYNRASQKFGEKFNNMHEAFAVILEELQEAHFESESFSDSFDDFWEGVKANDVRLEKLQELCIIAENAVCEWIQVAAMCYKAKKS